MLLNDLLAVFNFLVKLINIIETQKAFLKLLVITLYEAKSNTKYPVKGYLQI